MKNFNIKLFGTLAEKLETSEFDFPYFESSDALLNALKINYPQLRTTNFTMAIDRQIAQNNTELKGNEEIALLPPFSGG